MYNEMANKETDIFKRWVWITWKSLSNYMKIIEADILLFRVTLSTWMTKTKSFVCQPHIKYESSLINPYLLPLNLNTIQLK